MTTAKSGGAPADDPLWGAENRDVKAANIVQCLELVTELDLSQLSCVDIGCGSGGISYHLAPSFKSVCGVDPAPWQRWNDYTAKQPNLQFIAGSADSLSIESCSVDIVICNQVYEHVPSPTALIAQIQRILKPGGTCYFAGPNLLFPIEPHVYWPFVHWIPRSWALALLRTFSPEKEQMLDAYSTTYWTLTRWLGEFQIQDAVPLLMKHRAQTSGGLWQLFRPVPKRVLHLLSFLSPGFVFVLTKPKS
ncbi:MAG: class I SAM-dependent methyltransferase [Pseudomonadota bacterium]